MKLIVPIFIVFMMAFLIEQSWAQTPEASLSGSNSHDIYIELGSVILIPNTPVEGQPLRIYASAKSNADQDYYGTISFYIDGRMIGSPQNISIVGGRSDQVFMDWIPSFGGPIDIRATVQAIGITETNNTNNSVQLTDVIVDFDTDGDGVGNSQDIDIDNDGCNNEEEIAGGSNPQDPNDNACQTQSQSERNENDNNNQNPEDTSIGSQNNASENSNQNSQSTATENNENGSQNGSEQTPNSQSPGGGGSAGNTQNGNTDTSTTTVNNLGEDTNKNSIPDFLEEEFASGSIFQNNENSILGFRIENEAQNKTGSLTDKEQKNQKGKQEIHTGTGIKINSQKQVLGYRITTNDLDGDGIPNIDDPFPENPAPVLDLKIRNLGIKKILFDASDSNDSDGIVKYSLVLSETERVESTSPIIKHTFPSTGLYDIVFMIQDASGQVTMEKRQIHSTYFSNTLLIKLLSLLLIPLFIRRKKKNT